MKKHILLSLIALVGAASALFAQEEGQAGIPADVFYLMPKAGQGTIYYKSKSPVSGTFNICAIDNTIRYKDSKGTELAVDGDETINMITIGNASFRFIDGAFQRMYPLTGDVFLAERRDITVMNDSHVASYGMESQTTAVSEFSGMNSEGRHFTYEETKNFPYRMNQTVSLYQNGNLMRLNKKNLTKCFPGRKAEIEAWFKENKKMDEGDVNTVKALCEEWSK